MRDRAWLCWRDLRFMASKLPPRLETACCDQVTGAFHFATRTVDLVADEVAQLGQQLVLFAQDTACSGERWCLCAGGPHAKPSQLSVIVVRIASAGRPAIRKPMRREQQVRARGAANG